METFCGITTDGMLDYLTAIYKLKSNLETGKTKVSTTMLAEKMHVSPAAASSMSKRLEDSGFVERSQNDGITLSEQGRLAAVQMVRRHRLLEVFLIQVMEFTWDQVDVEAHRMEHAVSAAFEDRMDQLCGYPTHCPHGDPIPNKDGVMPVEELCALSSMNTGSAGIIRRVASDDPLVLRYLGQRALKPGTFVEVADREPFNGPMTISFVEKAFGSGSGGTAADNPSEKNGTQNAQSQILGAEIAAKIFVHESTK